MRLSSCLGGLGAALCAALLATPASATTWRSVAGFADNAKLTAALAAIDANDGAIDAWATSPSGQWIIVAGGKVQHSAGFDANLVTAAKLNLAFGRHIEGIACAPSGASCVLVHSAGIVASGGVPAALTARVNSWHASGWAVRDVELTGNGGWMLLGPGNVVAASSGDGQLNTAVIERNITGRRVVDVAIGPSGRWLVYQDTHPLYRGLDANTQSWVDFGVRWGMGFDRALLGPQNSFVLYRVVDANAAPDLDDPAVAVEFGLGDGDETIWARMADLGIAGVSIATIRDGEVATARGYGTRTKGLQQPVFASTPFDLASLSKYVGAVTVLATLADGGGLNLQSDVTSAGLPTINNWITRGTAQTPAQGFASVSLLPAMPAITLEQLLSHTAGLTLGGSTPIPASKGDDTVPTIDWLSGWACSADDCDWAGAQTVWFDPTNQPNPFTPAAPGGQFAYTSDGYLVAQAVTENVSGKSGTELVEQYVIAPLGLTDTVAGWPFSGAYASRAATQHGLSGPAERNYFPWIYAGGVTASVRDYAEMMLITMNDGVASNGTQVLSQQDARNIRRGRAFPGNAFSWGLGVDVDLTAGATTANGETFYHSGWHPGLSKTYMCGRPADGAGIVILLNTDAGDASDLLINEILDAFVAAMGWVDEDCR